MVSLGRFRLQAIAAYIRSRVFHFIAVWVIGLVLGAVLAPYPTASLDALLRPLVVCKVGLIPRLIGVSAPLAIAAFAAYLGEVRLLLSMAFLKAFQFSYCGVFVCSLYGNAGWLVRFLCQFADVFAVPVFCWFCIRYIAGKRQLGRGELAICAVLTLAAGAADHYIVVPFLANFI